MHFTNIFSRIKYICWAISDELFISILYIFYFIIWMLQKSIWTLKYHQGCNNWTQKDGYYVLEGHGTTNECYNTLDEAKAKCLEASDCFAVASQSNVCGGKYRVSHGGPSFRYWSNWQPYNLRSWELSCSILVGKEKSKSI